MYYKILGSQIWVGRLGQLTQSTTYKTQMMLNKVRSRQFITKTQQ